MCVKPASFPLLRRLLWYRGTSRSPYRAAVGGGAGGPLWASYELVERAVGYKWNL